MQQLTGLDTLFLTQESERTPMHISSLLIYDPSTAPGGKVRFKDILRLFQSRLHRAPIFRRKLREAPFGLDYPYWIEDPDFDLEFHVRHIALPQPGDWRQLCIQVARLHSRVLDRSHPLWECYVIEGLDNVEGLPPGCFALFLKMHHAAIDGVSGTEIIAAIHDTEPAPEPAESPRARAWQADSEPGALRLAARAAFNNMTQPARFLQTAGRLLPALRRVLADDGADAAPARQRVNTRFNGRVGAHRSVDGRFFPLAGIKSIRAAVPGSTVNDVVVALVGGALRAYLLAKNELPDAGLIAGAPINVRTAADRGTGGNLVSMMTLALRTDIADPRERLERVHAEAAASKELANAVGARTLTDLTQTIPPRIAALGFRAASEALLMTGAASPMNTIVSNVPGPQIPLYLCGARLLQTAGCGPVLDHMGLFHAVLSYDGGVSIMIAACRTMLPDPGFYAQCLEQSYRELEQGCAGAPPRRGRAKAGRAPAAPAARVIRARRRGVNAKSN